MRGAVITMLCLLASLLDAAELPLANEELLHSARVWEAHERGDLARLALEKLVAARPDSPDALLELGELQLRMGDVSAAARTLDELSTRFKGSATTAILALDYRLVTRDRLALSSLRRLLELNRYAQARQALGNLFPQTPRAGAAAIEYYSLLGRMPGNWAIAAAGLRALSAGYPDDPRYQFALAKHLVRNRDTQLSGVQLLAQLAQREDIHLIEVDDALIAALTVLGARQAPANIVQAYQARHPDNVDAKTLLVQQGAQLQADERWRHDTLALIAPTLANGPALQIAATLQALRQTHDKLDHALTTLYALQRDTFARTNRAANLVAAHWQERGRMALQNNSYELADLYLRAALAFRQGEFEAAIDLSKRFDELSLADDAEALLTVANTLDAKSNWLFETRVRWLLTHARADEALALIEQRGVDKKFTAVERDALRATALSQRGNHYADSGNTDAAIADLLAAVALNPREPWSRFRLANLYAALGQSEAGSELLNDGVRSAPDDAEMHYAQALYLSSLNQPAAALASLNHIAEAHRSAGMVNLEQRLRVTIARERAMQSYQAGDLNSARATLLAVESLAANSLDNARDLANGWIDLQDANHGIALLDAYAQTHPTEQKNALLALADALNRAQDSLRLHDVLTQLKQRTDLDTSQQQQLASLTRALSLRQIYALERAGNFDAAAAQLDGLLAHEPQDRALRIARAELDVAAGHFTAARDRYAGLVAEQPEDVETRLAYVRALMESKDMQLARLQLQAAWAILAKQTELNIDHHVTVARRALSLDDPSTALQALQAVLHAQPNHGDALLLAGRSELALRHFANARDYFVRAEHISDNATMASAHSQREAIDARMHKVLTSGIQSVHKPGDAGISTFNSITLPNAWQFARNYEQRITVRADAVRLDAGKLPADSAATTLFGTVQSASGPRRFNNDAQQGLSLGVIYDTDTLSADIGTTPLGFLIPNVLGGIAWQPRWRSLDIELGIERRAVTSSVLSYAGLRDPITGDKWGAVLQSGPYAQVGLYKQFFSISGALRLNQLEGTHVLSNRLVSARVAADWTWWSGTHDRASTGINFNVWRYRYNLQNYTFGSGGYYSPQSYLSLSLPIELQGVHVRWSYRLRASIGSSQSRTEQIAFYPNDAALQAAGSMSPLPVGYDSAHFASSSGSGLSVAASLNVERRVFKSLVIGGQFGFDRSDYYHPVELSVYLRHWLGEHMPSTMSLPRPLRPYNEL